MYLKCIMKLIVLCSTSFWCVSVLFSESKVYPKSVESLRLDILKRVLITLSDVVVSSFIFLFHSNNTNFHSV